MPVSNKFIALGGIAAGMGQALQHKQDQQHQEDMQHTQMITNLVSQGLSSGTITDPEAAFQFLLSGGKGKKGGKGAEIPAPIQTLIQGAQQAAGGPGGPGGANSPQDQMTGQGPGVPGAGPGPGPAGPDALIPGAQPPAPPPGTFPQPGMAQPGGPGFRFLTPEERDYRALNLKGAEASATTFATYGAKVSLARKMFQDGLVKSMDEAFERVGLKEPFHRPFAPRPVGRPVPVDQVPEGALTAAGVPVDRTAKFFQPVILSYPDGSFETRFEPSSQAPIGAGAAGTDTARMRTKIESLTATHKDWTPEQVRAEAGRQIQAEDAGRAQGVDYSNTQKGQGLGVLPSVYDDIPPVTTDPTTGQVTPESKAAFEDAINKLPKGNSLLPWIKKAADYEAGSNAYTQRQLGGLNRAEFDSLVMRYDPSYSPAKYDSVQKLRQDWLPNGTSGKAMVSAKTVINHMTDLAKASQVLNKYQTDRAGGLTNWATTNWARVFNSDKVAQDALRTYQTKQKAVADELKRLFTVTGAGSQKEIDDWYALGNPYSTPTEKAAFIRGAGQLMTGRIEPLYDNYTQNLKKLPPSGIGFTSADYSRMRALGVDTSKISSVGGGVTTPTQEPPDAIKNAGPRKVLRLPNGDRWVTDDQGVPHFIPK